MRGAPIVQRALAAALKELGRVGYSALRVEDVAALARVNKTTVYRRWPTKEALVRAALLFLAERHGAADVPDTNSVRDDLILVARRLSAIGDSPEGRTIMRILAEEPADAEIRTILRSIREVHDAVPRAILERARGRGELRSDVDPALIFAILRAACDRSDTMGKEGHLASVTHVVDLILRGSLNSAFVPQPRRGQTDAVTRESGRTNRPAARPRTLPPRGRPEPRRRRFLRDGR